MKWQGKLVLDEARENMRQLSPEDKKVLDELPKSKKDEVPGTFSIIDKAG